MNCQDARRHWSLFHDSEGDAALFAKVNSHLAECPSCAGWFEQQSHVEHVIKEKLSPAPRDASMWERLASRVGDQSATTRKARPLLLSAIAVVVVASLLLAFGDAWFSRRDDQVTKAAIDYHERLTDGRDWFDLASHSDLEVEAYLRRRVTFPVRCPPRQDSGFHVSGAGVKQLAETQAAYLVGTVNEDPISIFIFPRTARDLFDHPKDEIDAGILGWQHAGYRFLLREFDQNLVLVIGQGDASRLRRVLRAYGSYPHVHG